jgi:hypothetical protein
MLKILSPENICKACSLKCTGLRDGNCEIFASLKAVAQAQMRENARELIAKFQQLNSGNAITGYIAVITPEEYEALRP